MNKGFTLVELLLSFFIGLVIVMGVLKVFFITTQSWRYLKSRVRVSQNLSLAQHELTQIVMSGEPDFWQHYPRRSSLIHENSQADDMVDVGRECPYYEDTDCVTTWDLKPDADEPLTYRMTWQPGSHLIFVDPHEREFPTGPGSGVGPMSVFLFVSLEESFPVLISGVQSPYIIPVERSQQPWQIPQSFDPAQYQAVHLGRLDVVHHTRAPDEKWRGVMMHHRLIHDGQRWKRKRGFSSHTHLRQMAWSDESNDGAQLLLIGQGANAQPGWVSVLDREFDREVDVVSLTF